MEVFVDACLVGGGSWWKGCAFLSFKLPKTVVKNKLAINDLELFNVLVMLRNWEKLRRQTVRIWCDNNTSVKSLFSGRAKNDFMSGCLRELCYVAASGDIFLDCKHIPGKDNNEEDLVSRAFNSPEDWFKYEDWCKTCDSLKTVTCEQDFRAPDTI